MTDQGNNYKYVDDDITTEDIKYHNKPEYNNKGWKGNLCWAIIYIGLIAVILFVANDLLVKKYDHDIEIVAKDIQRTSQHFKFHPEPEHCNGLLINLSSLDSMLKFIQRIEILHDFEHYRLLKEKTITSDYELKQNIAIEKQGKIIHVTKPSIILHIDKYNNQGLGCVYLGKHIHINIKIRTCNMFKCNIKTNLVSSTEYYTIINTINGKDKELFKQNTLYYNQYENSYNTIIYDAVDSQVLLLISGYHTWDNDLST